MWVIRGTPWASQKVNQTLVNPDLPDFVTSARGGTGVRVFSNIGRAFFSIYVSVSYSAKYSHVANAISVKAGTHT